MRYLIVACSIGLMLLNCAPKETVKLQTFSPIMIDMAKLDDKNYEDLCAAVNDNYASETREFNDARLFRQEKMFRYFHVYSGRSTACYRVTVDSNRSKIINIQPDCPIDEQ